MNFLGHCYLCLDQKSLITGNLGGDYYKGNLSNHNYLPKHILNGIKLHRFIDDFTDQATEIIQVAKIFQQHGINKVSFIGCDIMLDHFLAKKWQNFSDENYNQYVQSIYAEVKKNLAFMNEDFKFFFEKMQEYGWLNHYNTIEGISVILKQFSRRIGFQNQLEQCSIVYVDEMKTIENLFEAFLIKINIAVQNFLLELNQSIS